MFPNFVKPPVGDLRWRPPRPAEKWDGTFNATTPGGVSIEKMLVKKLIFTKTPCSGPSCTKNDWAPSYGEDCLYLNIFVPKKAVEEDRKVPVGFWIHGGGFESGAGSVLIYDGRFWAHESDMVLG